MKKTVGLGLLAMLLAGLMSNAAFADIRYLNNNDRYHNDRARFQIQQRYQAQQRCDRNMSWQQQKAQQRRIAELRRLADKRRKAEQQYLKHLQKARLADARYDRYDRRYDRRNDRYDRRDDRPFWRR